MWAVDTVKKEMIIAGLIGVFLGLGIGFLASNVKNIKISTKFQKPTSSEITPTEAPNQAPQNNAVVSLTVSSPDDESVTTLSSITVEGKTDPKSLVIVSSEDGESVVTPSADGSFSQKVNLTPEENQLVIASYNDTGSEVVKRLVIYDKPEE